MSPAPNAFVASCCTPLMLAAPMISRIDVLGVPCEPPAAALESVIVKSGVVGFVPCAARCAAPVLFGSRAKTIRCVVLSNDAVTPSCAALKLVTNPSMVDAFPPAPKS